jgi:peptide/nickel transport system substrate-binding protein
MRSRWAVPAGWILLAAVVLGCGAPQPAPAAAPEPRRGGTAVLGSTTDVDSWNEYLSRQSFAGGLLRRIYLRLARERGDGRDEPVTYEPSLARSWSWSEDGLSLTFELREALWSDGRPITAGDVRFTWLAQTSEQVPWIGASAKAQIRDVEVLDARRVTFHFRTRYPFQLADAVDGGIVPEHVFGQVPFAEWAEGHDWSQVRVGSGPFLLERHAPGHEIVLQRNPRYYREGYPLLERVVVRIVPDTSNLLTQLLAGEIDYVEGVAPREASGLAARQDTRVLAFDWPSYDFLGWNGSRPPFDDPELRRAMTLAIDREALVEDLLFGYGGVSKGPLLSFWWGADRELDPWPYDPERARRILAERGYATRAADGSPAGGSKTLEIELLTNAGNRLREEMLVKIQEQLSRVGVRVHARPIEMRALRQRAASGDYDGYLGGWVYTVKDLRSIFGSSARPPDGANVVFYRSDEVDGWLDRMEHAEDWRALKPALDGLQRRIHEDQPYSFLYESKRLAVHGARLSGVAIDVPSDPLAGLESFWVR